jgi:hypothetical protein
VCEWDEKKKNNGLSRGPDAGTGGTGSTGVFTKFCYAKNFQDLVKNARTTRTTRTAVTPCQSSRLNTLHYDVCATLSNSNHSFIVASNFCRRLPEVNVASDITGSRQQSEWIRSGSLATQKGRYTIF